MLFLDDQIREVELSQKLSALLPEPALGAVRIIRSSDEELLTPAEAAQCANAVAKVRQQRGAARYLARILMAELGLPAAEILRAPSGEPLWPLGIVGSISHDDATAAVVLSLAHHGIGLGVDVEPACPLPAELVPLIANPAELAEFGSTPTRLRLLFAIKEAVFKAVFPQDKKYLEFHDVSVDAKAGTAETCYGRRVRWRGDQYSRILAVAWV